ncbi:hypothetical protein BBK82_00150 [Lentzea guizhouensis]|uniref:Uncharacterized protein n=1 Tax=Lentzea guizhouensis TaxID=1586287 RepID=A0A1B2HAI6_9PSEU|nr:hypothetical protein [Lentzea guizhouensis]ANZ34723.1 hypothetical protein BBK82_00150 [Lentzea guizhouensis]
MAAAAMVLIAGAALIAPSLVSRDTGVGSASAGEVLEAAALSADDRLVQPGQFLYVLQYSRWSSSDSEYRYLYLEDQTLETWIPAARGDVWLHRRTNTGNKQFLLGSEQDVPKFDPPLREDVEWRAAGGAWLGDERPVSFRSPSPEYVAALPREPRALYEKMRSEAGGDEGRLLLQMITEGLGSGLYPADARAAVYQALTFVPRLEVVDRTAVLDSRTGTALGVTDGDVTVQIVINQDTGDYLGSRAVQARDAHGLKAGQVLSTTAITTRVVAALGAQS